MSLLCDSHVNYSGMGVDSTLREKGAENGDLVLYSKLLIRVRRLRSFEYD